MDGIAYSNHAGQRMQQRGIRDWDIDRSLTQVQIGQDFYRARR